MKKIVALLLAALMLLAFVSCGETAKKTTAPAEEKTAEEKTTAPAEETAEKEVLVMATNATFPPYEYYEGETMVGIDVEIAKALADNLNMTLEIKDVLFDSIIAGIETGSFTIGMAGMTVTEDRLEKVNFSDPYAKGVQVVIVKEGSEIASPDDLEGKKIGVQQGTTGDLYATDDYGEENVSKFKNGPEAVQALVSGSVDAVIIDNEPAKSYVAANEGLTILETSYADEDYAIAIAKGNTELLEKINTALVELTQDGTIAAIVEKYIPSGN